MIPDATMTVAPPNIRRPSDNPVTGWIPIPPMPYDPPVPFGTSVKVRDLMAALKLTGARGSQILGNRAHR